MTLVNERWELVKQGRTRNALDKLNDPQVKFCFFFLLFSSLFFIGIMFCLFFRRFDHRFPIKIYWFEMIHSLSETWDLLMSHLIWCYFCCS